MFILDSLLVNGLGFVLDKVAALADQEQNDPDRQRERLLEAQMRLENGEIDQAQFSEVEADVFARIRQIRERTQPAEPVVGDEHRVAEVEISVIDKHS